MLSEFRDDDVPSLQRKARVTSAGLGWEYESGEYPVRFNFDRFTERRDGVDAEVSVLTLDGDPLLRRRLSLLDSRSLAEVAKDLDELQAAAGVPWRSELETAVANVLAAYRVGEKLEVYQGRIERPVGVEWLTDKLVMRDVINVWVAAGSTGKSTLAIMLAVAHALGKPFLGRETLRGVPLYLDWESTPDDFREKVHDALAGFGASECPPIYRIRMRRPLKHMLHQIVRHMTKYGVTLVIVDAVAAAGGAFGDGNYESAALDLEQALQALPPCTVVLLDHVTGEDVRAGGTAVKARGSVRKTEFARNQWSIALDSDARDNGKHVVGFRHTKVNRVQYMQPFGVEILHGDGAIFAREIPAEDVGFLLESMTDIRRIYLALKKHGGMKLEQIPFVVFGADDKKAQERTARALNAHHGELIHQIGGVYSARLTPHVPRSFGGAPVLPIRPTVVQDDGEVPF